MTLEIHVLAWNRHKNMAALNRQNIVLLSNRCVHHNRELFIALKLTNCNVTVYHSCLKRYSFKYQFKDSGRHNDFAVV